MFGPTMKFSSSLMLAALFATATALVGCGGDDASRFSVVITSDSTSLVEDGSNFATITVSVLDQSGNPPEIGSPVAVVLPQGGALATTGEAQGVSTTDATGTAQFQIVCQEGVDFVLVAASFETTTEVFPQPIQCTPAPGGNWSVEILSRDTDVQAGGTANATFRALQENGAPVPLGSSFIAEVTSGNLTFLNGLQQLAIRSSASTGEFSVSVRLPDDGSPGTFCVRFADQRFSEDVACARFGDAGRGCFANYSPTSIRADGVSVSNLSFTVIDSQGTPVSDAVVNATIAQEGVGGIFVEDSAGASPAATKSLTTDRNGTASTFVQAATAPGSPVVSASTTIIDALNPDDPAGATGEVALDCQFDTGLIFEPPPSCRFQPVETSDGGPLGISGSVFSNNASVTACFTRIDGEPVVGESVTFRLDATLPGYAFAPAVVPTDTEGCATTQLQTGDVPGIVTVRAVLGTGSFSETCFSDPVPVSSGLPSASNTILNCSPSNMGGFLESVGSQSFHTCQAQCELFLRDRFLNVLTGERFAVSLFGENGYTSAPQSPDDNGRIVWDVGMNGNHPYNFDGPDLGLPQTDANGQPDPGLTDSNRCELNQCPSDSVMQFIAVFDGEEEYSDANGNGAYDDGEVFVDLPEPFLDADNNNEFNHRSPIDGSVIDPRFWDVALDGNAAGQWDPPNQRWDELTKVFLPAHITSTGDVDPERTRFTINGVPATYNPDSDSFFLSNIRYRDRDANFQFSVSPRDSRDMPITSASNITLSVGCTGVELENDPIVDTSGNDYAGVDHVRELVPVDANGVQVPPLTPLDHYQVRWDVRYDEAVDYSPRLVENFNFFIAPDIEPDTPSVCSGTLTIDMGGAGNCVGNTVQRTRVFALEFPDP